MNFEQIILTPGTLTTMLASAIAPVTLISGVAFLITIMSDRYGRSINRIRTLLEENKKIKHSHLDQQHLEEQIKILFSRIRALRNTMTFATGSIFFVVLTICGSFSSLLFKFPNAIFIAITFMIALTFLVVAVSGLIRDILISLQAIKIEIKIGTNIKIQDAETLINVKNIDEDHIISL